MKIVLYTAIVGNYDKLRQHKYVSKDYDYVCFTDQKIEDPGMWTILPLRNPPTDNVRAARWHKLMAAELFPAYDYSLWVDAIVDLRGDFMEKRVSELIKEEVLIAANIHYSRKCLYTEAIACQRLGKDDPAVINEQVAFYREIGFPQNLGLFETNMLFRKHNDSRIKVLMNEWWEMIAHFSRRDQLSFTYVLNKAGLTCANFFPTNTRGRSDFHLAMHI